MDLRPSPLHGEVVINAVEFWQLVDEVYAVSCGDMTRKCAVLAQHMTGLEDVAFTAFC